MSTVVGILGAHTRMGTIQYPFSVRQTSKPKRTQAGSERLLTDLAFLRPSSPDGRGVARESGERLGSRSSFISIDIGGKVVGKAGVQVVIRNDGS